MAVYTPTHSDTNIGLKFVHFSNEFPPDDLNHLLRQLYQHSKTKHHHILARFLEEATCVIRDEVRHLPASLKALIPPFETILNFADFEDLRKSRLCGSIDGVLLCVVQLGAFMGYMETHPNEVDFDTTRTFLAGLGTGLFAAAAVSLAPTMGDLALTGAEVVRQAFRLGVLVDDVSHNLEPRGLMGTTATPDTWAYVVPGVSATQVQRELDLVNAHDKVPETSKVFISAISTTSATVSGPPSRLKHLFRTADFFRHCKYVALPVFGGLCHAAHIYNDDHVRQVAGTASMERINARFLPRIPIYSTSTGAPFPAKNARELFEHIVRELLTQRIEWNAVIESILQQTRDLGVSQCHMFVFHQSVPVHDLNTALATLTDCETITEEMIPWMNKIDSVDESEGARGPLQSKIAIVGMSCRMPAGATDTEKFWELLEKGLDVHRKIPADRFDVETHYDPDGKRVNASHTPYGCFIDEPGLFDAPFFNMSPREAQQTDPMQRLALVTAYEALERAGYVANRTASTNLHRIGTFYGQASDDYREVNTAQEIGTYFIPGGCRAFGPGRINYFFKFSGPSYSIDTACSSSLATIQAACTSLWNGDTDMVVAGGMNVLSNSDAFAGLSRGHFLSKTPNACKTWDCDADGYCRADAVASIVMKRLEDAEADNDNILGVIVAAATNHSAEAVSITHPHAGHQAYLGRQVISRAGVDPLDVGFVEMHGTGTQAGDFEEIRSVSDVFVPPSRRRSSKNPLYIGAVKANVGHSEAAAGVTALLKVLLMLQKNAIPPHVGIKTALNPKFPKDLEARNLRIPYKLTEWPRVAGKKRMAVVNNFSAAGGNTTVLLHEAPVRKEPSGEDSRPKHVVAVSAKSKISLKGNLERMVTYLNNPHISLADLSYTTTARRHHHNYRVVITVSDISQAKQQLENVIGSVDSHKPIPATGQPPVVFAFTGQGASHRSMNLELFHHCPVFRSQISHLDRLAQGQGFPSFIPAVDGTYPHDHKHSPVVTQLGLVAVEMALAQYWASLGVWPDVVIGHSLGEYAALHTAGVLSASDTLFLVGQRALMLEGKCRAGSRTMMAVRASLGQIQDSSANFKGQYEVACVNGPRDTVLSGTREQMDAMCETLQAHGYRCTRLDVDFAFHSEQTDPILDDFEQIATTGALFRPPNLPVISPLLGKVIFDDKTITANYMRRATRETVDFLSALRNAQKISTVDETMAWVEIGPHPVCLNFVKTTLSSVNVTAASIRRNEDNWSTMAQSLGLLHKAGLDVNWNEFHHPFEKTLRLLDLPTYSWNDKNYWIMYNGDWALTKGNSFYDAEKAAARQPSAPAPVHEPVSSLRTSTVQQIIEETFRATAGKVVMRSDLMQPDFLAAAQGHSMNGYGVVTSSIHADIVYTLGDYLFKKLRPKFKGDVHMNISNLVVLKGLVAQKKARTPQLIQVSIETDDINWGTAHVVWYNVSAATGLPEDEHFATANVYYDQPADWLASWVSTTHLVQGRIADLQRLADEGLASRLSRNMAYLLFASNLVDYADKYRGMQSVVLHELEAYADVVLTEHGGGGVWTVPPHFIDSVAHLAGFVMNVSDAVDTKAHFCVTPGWGSMRFAKPLVAGQQYRSYVKMIPTAEDPSVYLGDVYVLQNHVIIGMVGAIKFRRYPRLLLNRFFTAPDEVGLAAHHQATTVGVGQEISPQKPSPALLPTSARPIPPPSASVKHSESNSASAPSPEKEKETLEDGGTASRAIAIIAEEAGLELSDLHDAADFSHLGVDSLMSLVIAEKLRDQLGVVVSGSLFLEYPTVGDLRAWLLEYYS